MNTPSTDHQVSNLLLGALRRVLRPLVRLMVANGVQYPMLLELLKQEFVQVADKEFPLADRPQSDSRISVLTGVHRKDVRRLRPLSKEDQAISSVVSLGGQIAASWLASAMHTDAKGHPLPLPRLRSVGGRISFEALVESLSKDVRPRAVLDEWLRVGAARIDHQDRVILNSASFIPNKGFEEKLHYLAQNGHDHLQTMVHNVTGDAPPYLDRSVYYARLTPESVLALQTLAAEQGMKALQAVNRASAQTKNRQTKSTASAVHRINFGVYLYIDPPLSEPDSSLKATTTSRGRAASPG